jgi:hypothetical protein
MRPANPFVPNLLWFSSLVLLIALFVLYIYGGVWYARECRQNTSTVMIRQKI